MILVSAAVPPKVFVRQLSAASTAREHLLVASSFRISLKRLPSNWSRCIALSSAVARCTPTALQSSVQAEGASDKSAPTAKRSHRCRVRAARIPGVTLE